MRIRTTWRLSGKGDGRSVLDRERLVALLPEVEYRRAPDEQQLFDEASLPASLPLMLKLDQEAEYLVCREVAERALGSVPEPDSLPG
ncbi:hypothetical protein M8542_44055 [Amycolatopsis sp. OK19-0408]|uniref:Uncharacterized protein n=1 Tax=Amycolatopsis iheyensis TaxID=2945988 RepID=A0A9X2NJB4_9PSEU|nr:hypothetical protein [Amycolatopsis iheyensis]MCR6489809.1 hypothetical protein [Amycolatopsis iheyensis]